MNKLEIDALHFDLVIAELGVLTAIKEICVNIGSEGRIETVRTPLYSAGGGQFQARLPDVQVTAVPTPKYYQTGLRGLGRTKHSAYEDLYNALLLRPSVEWDPYQLGNEADLRLLPGARVAHRRKDLRLLVSEMEECNGLRMPGEKFINIVTIKDARL